MKNPFDIELARRLKNFDAGLPEFTPQEQTYLEKLRVRPVLSSSIELALDLEVGTISQCASDGGNAAQRKTLKTHLLPMFAFATLRGLVA